LVISCSVLLRKRNVSGNSCRNNWNKFFMFSNFFFENRTVYEIRWKNTAEPDRPQMTIWLTRIACWITKSTNTHSEYVIIIALPLQQWLQESASMLRIPNVFSTLTLDGGSGHSRAPADLLSGKQPASSMYKKIWRRDKSNVFARDPITITRKSSP
jgi:hypothetical protein